MADAFIITVNDAELQAMLKKLQDGLGNMRPMMQGIGEGVMQRAKNRFETSTDPAGNKWLPNAEATYGIMANKLGKGYLNKDGRVNKRGASKLAGKKPLIGETKKLKEQFYVDATEDYVVIGNSMHYAAIQQFGGQAGKNKKVTIPARAFLPVTLSGDLYEHDQVEVMQLVQSYIDELLV